MIQCTQLIHIVSIVFVGVLFKHYQIFDCFLCFDGLFGILDELFRDMDSRGSGAKDIHGVFLALCGTLDKRVLAVGIRDSTLGDGVTLLLSDTATFFRREVRIDTNAFCQAGQSTSCCFKG